MCSLTEISHNIAIRFKYAKDSCPTLKAMKRYCILSFQIVNEDDVIFDLCP